MLRFMQEGGWGSWFVLFFSILALAAAVQMARRPDRSTLALLRGITVGTVFSSLAGVLSGIASTLHVAGDPERVAQLGGEIPWYRVLVIGLGESMACGILGFGLLAVAWLIASLGLRRLGDA
ncbi:MAG TPA: hypothetical protein VKZ63_05860 [Kofleriaceae bacterium]|nr:hypothetical protein [Kofleriaceae bacterium]